MIRLALTDKDYFARHWFRQTAIALGCTVKVGAMASSISASVQLIDLGLLTSLI